MKLINIHSPGYELLIIIQWLFYLSRIAWVQSTLINVMVSVFASSTVDHGFEPWSCQTKDYKSGIQITKMIDTSITLCLWLYCTASSQFNKFKERKTSKLDKKYKFYVFLICKILEFWPLLEIKYPPKKL
jgi:hypothetical protein